jgi:predicted DNA-binding protein (UPF0251 family)
MGVINVPRKRRKCRVEFLPPATYYKPAGVPLRELEEVALSVEEFEALRLKDMEGLEQIQCAERMWGCPDHLSAYIICGQGKNS